jgi:ABC-type polysaccharide/polyol phosphate export permease
MSARVPIREYDSAARAIPLVGEFVELVRYRDLLAMMIVNIAKSRYSRSVLGVLWTLMNPLLYMLVLTVAFSSLFRTELPNYPVYVMAGMLCWSFFTTATVFAMNSLVWGGGLLKRIYVPRTIFAFAAVGNGLTSFLLSLIPLAVLMLVLDHPWRAPILILPVAVLLLATFVLGVSLFVSSLAALFADFVEFYQVLLQAFFFLTPIMYPIDILPDWMQGLMRFNPMHQLIQVFRTPLYEGRLPDAGTLVTAFASSVVALAVGWVVFTRRAEELPYRI